MLTAGQDGEASVCVRCEIGSTKPVERATSGAHRAKERVSESVRRSDDRGSACVNPTSGQGARPSPTEMRQAVRAVAGGQACFSPEVAQLFGEGFTGVRYAMTHGLSS